MLNERNRPDSNEFDSNSEQSNDDDDDNDNDNDNDDDDDDNDEHQQTSDESNDEIKLSSDYSKKDKQRKRNRTTILPEQQDFLLLKYQNESNPTRKMLEDISSEVKLKKRVVQVWFQNTRARERKHLNFTKYLDPKDSKCSETTKDAPMVSSTKKQPKEFYSIDFQSNEQNHLDDLPLDLSKSSSSKAMKRISQDYQQDKHLSLIDEDKYGSADQQFDDGDISNDQDLKHFSKDFYSKTNSNSNGNGNGTGTGSTFRLISPSEHSSPSDSHQSSNSTNPNGQRRFRTQMTPMQIKLMKHIFLEYRTPTMWGFC